MECSQVHIRVCRHLYCIWCFSLFLFCAFVYLYNLNKQSQFVLFNINLLSPPPLSQFSFVYSEISGSLEGGVWQGKKTLKLLNYNILCIVKVLMTLAI